jgi:phytoene/squalene synthetase
VAPYVELAERYGYALTVIDLHISVDEALRRNKHYVPKDHLEDFEKEFEPWESAQ